MSIPHKDASQKSYREWANEYDAKVLGGLLLGGLTIWLIVALVQHLVFHNDSWMGM